MEAASNILEITMKITDWVSDGVCAENNQTSRESESHLLQGETHRDSQAASCV